MQIRTSVAWGALYGLLSGYLPGCLLGGDGDVVDVGPQSPISDGVTLSLSEVPPESVDIAEALLKATAGSEATPEWTDASRLRDRAYVYLRQDVEGPAYYEFGVTDGGRILVATGAHDSPVPAFSDLGAPIASMLYEQASRRGKTVAGLHRLNSNTSVATDTRGHVVAALGGPQLDGDASLAEYERAMVPDDDELMRKSVAPRGTRVAYGQQWKTLYRRDEKSARTGAEGSPKLAVSDVKWLYHRDLLRARVRWDQPDVDPGPKTCWAGCAPVALAQVAAYLAYSDRWGNPKYAGSGARNLYPNVSTSATAPQAIQLISSLHSELGSLCWPNMVKGEFADTWVPFVNESAVAPWNMDRFKAWARKRNASVRFSTSWGGPWGGDEDAAWNAIRRGNPVVLGWNYTHYNVGVGAGFLNGDKYVWVNNGWGGNQDGWLLYDKNAMFFSGIVRSWVSGK